MGLWGLQRAFQKNGPLLFTGQKCNVLDLQNECAGLMTELDQCRGLVINVSQEAFFHRFYEAMVQTTRKFHMIDIVT